MPSKLSLIRCAKSFPIWCLFFHAFFFPVVCLYRSSSRLLLMEEWLQQQAITQPARASICRCLESAAKADLAEAEAKSLPRLSRQGKAYGLRVGAVLAKFLHAEFQPHFNFSRFSLLDSTLLHLIALNENFALLWLQITRPEPLKTSH